MTAKRYDGTEIVFDFKCVVPECGAEGELGLQASDGSRPFNCPEGCGAVYAPFRMGGIWRLKCVVEPVFGAPA